MKKSLTSLFALAFVLMFGMVNLASAEKHMAPAAPAANSQGTVAAPETAKEEMKKEKKMKKKAAKKAQKEVKEEAKDAAPAK